ncbi:BgTH12-07923 [Blumeria graminis f. sp. triticale]|uniref:dihydroorotase n=3 Tax=Blumeria graminis TaxID=34373 RepID=A0A381LG71_BLUGR|nr:Dihydroorotase [Blumeria graminis f. sp. tritici 96224]CAD6502260.1 BgTH12-07923 [Blumeria graminis f. sp. triticale]VDB86328.1 Bgt-1356 [Blumeria graminis f. sp. tritici]
MSYFEKFDEVRLNASADFHVHLRDGTMMKTVVPTIRAGGVNTVYVMPNLNPPLISILDALAYKERLQQEDPSITYLMSMYLHESITPEMVVEAKAHGIMGIKSYPAGVTTNSSSGVLSYEPFYPVFAAMEKCGMILNLHGECPSDHEKDITILNAEHKFLPTLLKLHSDFPALKIVLEHCTTKAAIETVRECGANVVGTITVHHLFLTVDDWADNVHHFCKPVAKWPSDRAALIKAAIDGSGKFFLGSDSAPHDIAAKQTKTGKTCAGVFTQPYVTQFFLEALEQSARDGIISPDMVTKEILGGFLGDYGRNFYGVTIGNTEHIVLHKKSEIVRESFTGEGVEVVPFRCGKSVWRITWT